MLLIAKLATTSALKVEKVVKLPRKPVIKNSFHSADSPACASKEAHQETNQIGAY
jgi:hypothetical protein